jgi:UDP-N-acetylglucosamine:LPS N-acetylglucosamine transferase
MRNDSSGEVEQLNKGKNGYYLDSHNYHQVVESLEEILNKQKTSNEKLANMSKHSYSMASKQADNEYDKISKEIYEGFTD